LNDPESSSEEQLQYGCTWPLEGDNHLVIWYWRRRRRDSKGGRLLILISIIIIIHLLGLAPAGYLAAPDNGP
jgi:hypothetical protein